MVLVKDVIELFLPLLDRFMPFIMVRQEAERVNHGADSGSASDLGPQGAMVPVVLDNVHFMLRVIAEIYRILRFGKMLSKPF